MSEGYQTREDLARRVDLLQQELAAETRRVQSLERNLDAALRSSGALETKVARLRAMLTVALGEDPADLDLIRAEIAGTDRGGVATALSHALLNVLGNAPEAQQARP